MRMTSSGFILLEEVILPKKVINLYMQIMNLKHFPGGGDSYGNRKARPNLDCLLEKKVPNGENLKQRSFQGSSWCVMCQSNEETINHLFLHCPYSAQIWNLMYQALAIHIIWQGDTISEACMSW